MIAALVRSIKHINQHGIDPKARRMEPVNRHVRGWIAQFAPTLVAGDHRSFDPVPMAQHGACGARIAIGKGIADRGRGNLTAFALEQFCNGHTEPHFLAKGDKILCGAKTPLAKAEVSPHDDMPKAEPIRNHPTREITG